MPGRHKRMLVACLTLAVAALATTVMTTIASAHTTRWQAGTLNIYGFGTGDDVAQSRAALAKAAVGIPVNSPSGGFNDQTFLADIASGNVPDLVYMDRQKVGTYAAKGALMPLTSCIKSQKINMKQYRIPAVQEVTYKGQVYGIPEFFTVRTIIVDNKVLDQTHTPISWLNPAKPAQMLKAAQQMAIVSGGKVSRIGFDPKLPEFFPLWAKAYGVDILSADGLHPHLNDPRAVAALTYAVNLIKAQGGYNAFMAFRNTWDFFGSDNQVAKDQIGAWPMEDWYYNVLASTSPDVHITGLQFRNLKNQPINYETGSAWAIPKGSKNAGAACTWARVITSVKAWMAAATNRLSIRQKAGQPYTALRTANAVADAQILKDTYKSINPYFDEAIKKLDAVQRFSFGIPASPASSEFQTAWSTAVTNVLNGTQSPKQALDQAQAQAVAAIKAAAK